MATILRGHRTTSMAVDDEGHRTYKIAFLVESDSKFDGPFTVLMTPGLPAPGSWWAVGNDSDSWAWRQAPATVTIHEEREGDLAFFWTIECSFSTKPPALEKSRCQDANIEDPLLEPQRVSGSFVKYTEEATHDRFGNRIRNSAWEQIRGPQVEFDFHRQTVKVEQNVAALELPLLTQLMFNVNDAPLWGLAKRCVMFSGCTWERIFYGTCYMYYKRTLDFDLRYNTFDRDILDEGTKVLNGKWSKTTGNWETVPIGVPPFEPDPDNPAHFIRMLDPKGQPMRVVLNGAGMPAVGDPPAVGNIHVERYPESNLLLLGIPTSF